MTHRAGSSQRRPSLTLASRIAQLLLRKLNVQAQRACRYGIINKATSNIGRMSVYLPWSPISGPPHAAAMDSSHGISLTRDVRIMMRAKSFHCTKTKKSRKDEDWEQFR